MKGLLLCERYYFEAVKPILEQYIAPQQYSAGLLGYGSDVFGFDTDISQDHNWGPRCIIFLHTDIYNQKDVLYSHLENELPLEFLGFSTSFTDKRVDHTQAMRFDGERCRFPLIDFYTLEQFFMDTLHFDVNQTPSHLDWMKFPTQRLAELTEGKVFHDGLERLHEIRQAYQFFPKDVALAKIILLWSVISEEMAFVGRCLHNDDVLGARLIVSRIVTRLIRICFLLEQRYMPYSKWSTVAFQGLDCQLYPLFKKTMESLDGDSLILNLCDCYRDVISFQNSRGIAEPANVEPIYYYNRPYWVPDCDDICKKLRDALSDQSLIELPLSDFCLDLHVDGLSF